MELSVDDFSKLVQNLRGQPPAEHDRRKATRYEMQATVTVAPVADGRVGTAFNDLTRDISVTGLGLLQSVPVAREQDLLVRLPRADGKRPWYIVCRVMHCRPVAHGLFGIGMEFKQFVNPGRDLVPSENGNGEILEPEEKQEEEADPDCFVIA